LHCKIRLIAAADGQPMSRLEEPVAGRRNVTAAFLAEGARKAWIATLPPIFSLSWINLCR
jgi:hypothetical protein